jgi:hypothetical protein
MGEHRLQGVYVDKRRMQTHDIKREIGGLERRPVVNIKAVDETSVLSSRCKSGLAKSSGRISFQ